MKVHFQPLMMTDAKEVNTWSYEEPYSIYSFSGVDDDLPDLLNGDFFAAFDEDEALIGYLCIGDSARVPGGRQSGVYEETGYVDIGLGLRPDLTGKGYGVSFVQQGLEYLSKQFGASSFRLVVLTFNRRAIEVYRRCGFTSDQVFRSNVRGEPLPFLSMKIRLNERGHDD